LQNAGKKLLHRKKKDTEIAVGHFVFPVETPYASVIGYVKVICDKQTNALALYYGADLIAEINVERFEITKAG
jgi:hypothetical protein